MNTINFSPDKENKTLIISSDQDGFMSLIGMIQLKLKMKDNLHETLIFKDYTGKEFRLRFDLLDT